MSLKDQPQRKLNYSWVSLLIDRAEGGAIGKISIGVKELSPIEYVKEFCTEL